MEDKQLPRMDFGTVFNDTFTFIFHNIKRLIPPLMLVTFPVLVIVNALSYILQEYTESFTEAAKTSSSEQLSEFVTNSNGDIVIVGAVYFAMIGLSILNWIFGAAVYERMTAGVVCGIDINGTQGIKEAIPRILPTLFTGLLLVGLIIGYLLVAALICGIIGAGGSALFGDGVLGTLSIILAVIIGMVFLAFYVWALMIKIPIITNVAVVEDVYYLDAIKKGWCLTSGSGWSIFALHLVVGLIISFTAIPGGILQLLKMPVMFAVYSATIGSISTVIMTVLCSNIYLGCKGKIEGATTEDILKFYDESTPSDKHDEAQPLDSL